MDNITTTNSLNAPNGLDYSLSVKGVFSTDGKSACTIYAQYAGGRGSLIAYGDAGSQDISAGSTFDSAAVDEAAEMMTLTLHPFHLHQADGSSVVATGVLIAQAQPSPGCVSLVLTATDGSELFSTGGMVDMTEGFVSITKRQQA